MKKWVKFLVILSMFFAEVVQAGAIDLFAGGLKDIIKETKNSEEKLSQKELDEKLLEAIERDNALEVEKYIMLGANINQYEKNALTEGILNDARNAVRVLLEHGADIYKTIAVSHGSPVKVAEEYNSFLFDLMKTMHSFFIAKNKAEIIFTKEVMSELEEKDQASMIRYVLNKKDKETIIEIYKKFYDAKKITDLLHLIYKYDIPKETIKKVLGSTSELSKNFFDELEKKQDFTNLMVEKYKNRLNLYINNIRAYLKIK